MLFYKIVNGQVPDYLTELVPPTVADTNNYNLRNRLNISQPSYRLSTYQQSYFPSTIKLWNTLDLNLRQLPTLPSFKSKLQQKYFQPKTVPSYFSFGDRYLSVLHARLRNKCSSLNSDLFKSKLVPSASCSCEYRIGICCFSSKNAALRGKSKDWLARNQNNVSEWSEISTQ